MIHIYIELLEVNTSTLIIAILLFFNFGQQYVENHADADSAKNEVLEPPVLDSNDNPAVNKDIQQGLKDGRNVGVVQKDFGNKYYYHEGHTYN